jgi:hypothetical protein
MEELDKKDWEIFQANPSDKLSVEEVKLIAELHAKYYKHQYQVPCSCNPKTVIKWIDDLNKIYDGSN